MGHGEEVTNAQCPMPQAAGRLSLSTHKGMKFPAAFNEKRKTEGTLQGTGDNC
ncbi:hypothetical protein [Nostoc sp.]|uniref:hypothetical protein n=1 Tax=Nostoc sp. TaxID=1180 RepID=UPI002FF818A0